MDYKYSMSNQDLHCKRINLDSNERVIKLFMNNLFSSFLIPCFISFAALAMEPADSSGMITINQWQDVSLFAGKIVAYSTNYSNNSTFLFSGDEYSLGQSEIKYGYISSRFMHADPTDKTGRTFYWNDSLSGNGYCLHQLIKRSNKYNRYRKWLIDFRLQEAQMKMRNVSFDELICIGQALANNIADFEFTPSAKETVFNLLENQFRNNGFQKTKIL